MKNEKRTFLQYCDICKAPVIDNILNFESYTVTELLENSNFVKIHFYCPYCIEKNNIKTDYEREIE